MMTEMTRMIVVVIVMTLMTFVLEMMMLMVVFSGKSVSLLTGLLFSGHYDHIIGRSVNHYLMIVLYPWLSTLTRYFNKPNR